MTPAVYQAFEEICSAAGIRGAVLEVGAVPGPDGLLGMACLRGAARRIGVNADPSMADEAAGIRTASAHDLGAFADGEFECVLCNATLEHDPFFWRSLAEMRRVVSPGGLIAIGVPGFAGMGPASFAPGRRWAGRWLGLLARLLRSDALRAGTATLGEHPFPRDYYRFSEQAVREVLLAGLEGVSTRRVMHPPRIVGWGRKP